MMLLISCVNLGSNVIILGKTKMAAQLFAHLS